MKPGSPTTQDLTRSGAGIPGSEDGRGLSRAHSLHTGRCLRVWHVDTCHPPAMLPTGATSPGQESSLQGGTLPAFPEKAL